MKKFPLLMIVFLFTTGCSNTVNGLKTSDSQSDLQRDDTNEQNDVNNTDKENIPDIDDTPDEQGADDKETVDNNEIPDEDIVIVDKYSASCAEVIINNPEAGDGEYTLYVENNPDKPWTAYCADMNSTPVDYLALRALENGSNFSAYAAGGGSSGTDVITAYSRVKIDPATFIVTTGDQRFATSSGEAAQGDSVIASMPYATASSCRGDSDAPAIANINLSGTAFVINDTFCTDGYQPYGEAFISPDNKTADITGGGYCGWTMPCPAVGNPYNNNGSVLQLSYQP